MTPQLRHIIVGKHNQLRNLMAGGFSKFKPAARMATMRWHPELAQLAALNVEQCVMRHDHCRNTPTFRYSGQNLATTYSNGPISLLGTLRSHIQAWFDEYRYTPTHIIQSFQSTSG